MIRPWLVLCAMMPVACGPMPPPIDAARLPPGLFGAADQDVAAVQYAQFAFADASRTYGDPAAGMQAVAAIEYIAGAMSTAPRWAAVPAATQAELLQARRTARTAVGIAPDAPSQLVVNSLSAARQRLQSGDQPGVQAALANPAFSLPPAETLQKLGNLPYLQDVNVATADAADAILPPDTVATPGI